MYCRKCGSELKKVGFVKEKGFDESTGKPRVPIFFAYECPNKRWHNFHDYRVLSDYLEIYN